MNKYRQVLFRHTNHGCGCRDCNIYHGKDRHQLTRIIRANLKRELQEEIATYEKGTSDNGK